MHSNQKDSGYAVRGGQIFDPSKADLKYFDDFRDRFKQDKKKAKKNKPSSSMSDCTSQCSNKSSLRP